jgi:hypothetical protein
MSLEAASWVSAIATVILAVGAIITAVLAKRAFDKQSEEVRILQQQAEDSAGMLKIQAGQLDAQHEQLHSLQKVGEKQIEVLGLQSIDLRESLEERKREAEGTRSAQASRVFLILNLTPPDLRSVLAGHPTHLRITAEVVNTSSQPAYAAWIDWPEGCTLSYRLIPNPESLGDVLPDKRTTKIREYPVDWNGDLSDLAFRFTDAAGVRWIRRPGGHLAEQE